MLRLIKQVGRYAGLDIFRANSDRFRWSHTVDEYYPVAPAVRWHKGKTPHTQICRQLERNRTEYQTFLDILQTNAGLIRGIALEPTSVDFDSPFWNNQWFSGFDAAALVNFIAWKKPTQYFEIGSGHSTRFVKYTVKALNLQTKITSIDPMPRQDIDRICDRIIRDPLESCDLAIFDHLAPGDVLFFDGSHRAFPNSDVVVFFFEVMPRLKPGVIVHIHDIFVPEDYPATWGHRLYNEQYLLAAMLMCEQPPFRVLAPLAFIGHDEALGASARRVFAGPAGSREIPFTEGVSFWLEMKGLN